MATADATPVLAPATEPTTNGAETTVTKPSSSSSPIPPVDPSIVLHPNDLAAVPAILGQVLTRGVAALAPAPLAGDAATARQSLLEAARSLVRALETPRETMIRHCWADNTAFAALTIGIETGVWAELGRDEAPKSVAHLAAAAGGLEEAFLARLLKHVAAMGYIVETARDEYRPTSFIKSLTIPIIGAGYQIL